MTALRTARRTGPALAWCSTMPSRSGTVEGRLDTMAGRALGTPRRAQLGALRGASTRSQMYALLRRAIVSLDLLPGQALSENELAARYGVSRTPVREALIRLADEGLVEVAPQLGTFVSRISVRDVVEIQFIRETLERASLPHAIKNITAADETYLRGLLDDQEEAGRTGDLLRWFGTDEDLHRTLLEIGGHPRVWPIVSSAKAHLDRVRMLSLPDPEILQDLHAQHLAIVDNVTGETAQEGRRGAEPAPAPRARRPPAARATPSRLLRPRRGRRRDGAGPGTGADAPPLLSRLTPTPGATPWQRRDRPTYSRACVSARNSATSTG